MSLSLDPGEGEKGRVAHAFEHCANIKVLKGPTPLEEPRTHAKKDPRRPKVAPERSKMAQDGPKMAHASPKMAPSWSK